MREGVREAAKKAAAISKHNAVRGK